MRFDNYRCMVNIKSNNKDRFNSCKDAVLNYWRGSKYMKFESGISIIN